MKLESHAVPPETGHPVGLALAFMGCALFVHTPSAVQAQPRVFVTTTSAGWPESPRPPVNVLIDGHLQTALPSARSGGGSGSMPAGQRIYSVVPAAPVVTGGSALAATGAAPYYYDALAALYAGRRLEATEAPSSPSVHDRGFATEVTAETAPGWRMRGNDPGNSGRADAFGPAMQTQPLWTFRPDANTYVWRPAIAPDGTIYVTTVLFQAAGVDGRLYALRPDGSAKWQAQLTSSSGLNVWASATPVLDDAGNIYVAWAHDVNFGSLTAISFDSNGNVRWRFEPKIELELASHQQPSLGHGVLYAALDTSFFFEVATHRASIFALDLATGTPVWHWTSPNLDTFFDGPALGDDGYVYHASAENPLREAPGYLYRIGPTGELDWSIDIRAGVIQAPVVDAENNVYLGKADGVVAKYDSAGDPLWTYSTLSGQIYASPVLNGGHVTVGAADAGLHVLDVHTGEREAVFAPDCFPVGQAADRSGNAFLYCLNEAGSVFGFGPGGRQLWTFDTGVGSSVSAVAIGGHGRLFVGNSETLHAYVAPVLGDLNCDGAVDLADVRPFVLAFRGEAEYAQRFSQCHRSLADVNGDGGFDVTDVVLFAGLLGWDGPQVVSALAHVR